MTALARFFQRPPVKVFWWLWMIAWLATVAIRCAHGTVLFGDVLAINVMVAVDCWVWVERKRLRKLRNYMRRMHIASTAAGLCVEDALREERDFYRQLNRMATEDERTG